MSPKRLNRIPPAGSGFFAGLALQIKLVVRLMADARVSPLLKILPVFSLIYWLVPDLLPGPVDDAALIFLGGFLFIQLCPQEVVKEHLQALTAPHNNLNIERDDVVDAEFHDISGGPEE